MLDLPVAQHCLCLGTAVSAGLHLALTVTTVLQALACGACHTLYSHLLRLAGFWLHFQHGGEEAWQGPWPCAAACQEVEKLLSSLRTERLVMLARRTWKRRVESQGCEPPRTDEHSCALSAYHDVVQSLGQHVCDEQVCKITLKITGKGISKKQI